MAGIAGTSLKRIPRIKFPQRHPKPAADSSSQNQPSVADEALRSFIARAASGTSSSLSASGKASAQPKRTPVSTEEIDAILLGGCI